MCRNIRPLFNFEPPASDTEVLDAARQYVRKISGFSKPSAANEAVFEDAVLAIAAVSRDLLAGLTTTAAPKDRVEEAAKRRARFERRMGARA